MSVERGQVLRVLEQADHPLGVRELLERLGLHPGQQTELKRVLRELVRAGAIHKEGKRFTPPGGVRALAAGVQRDVRRSGAPARRTGSPHKAADGRGPGRGRAEKRRDLVAGSTARGDWKRGRGPGRNARAPRTKGDREQYLDSLRALDDTVEGILHVHRDGFGFVHPLHDADAENVFLPPDQAARAMDGDRVIVQVVPGRGGRTAGVLLEVVGRIRQRVVGQYQVEGRHAWVIPSDLSLQSRIRVPPTQLARPGDMVKVVLGLGAAVLEPGLELFGEVVGVIGRPGEPSAEVLSVAYAHGFSDEFPDEVMAEADRYPVVVTEEEAKAEARRDLRGLPLITIDGADARDFDDAVYCERAGDGWRLVVAIADVSHYVREGRPLDVEALRRGTSVYLPDRVLPMLPERLSNGICSLRPDEDRLCVVADMRFDGRAHLRAFEVYPGVMRSHARCTYEEVQDVLDGKDVPHPNFLRPHLQRLMSLARALNAMRRARGPIDFDLPEYKVVLDERGMPVRLDKRERRDSHRLVEECMLAANEAVAKFFRDRELPSVYRFHGEPDEEKLEAFAQLARAHGFPLPPASEIESRDLARFLDQLEGHPERRALNQLMLRAMMQAVYSAESVGHYGLGATHYLHFTSPIRRYPDLIVHRLLKEHWARGGKVPPKAERERQEERLEALAVQSSERERAAVDVEREVVAFYQTLLMKDRVGEQFAATVASVTDFGFFVELDELHVEGLVRGEALGPHFEFDPAQHALVWPDGRRVKVGQKLTVQLLSANVQRRQLDFAPVALDGAQEAPARAGSPHPVFDRLRALAAKKEKGSERAGFGWHKTPRRKELRSGLGQKAAPGGQRLARDKFGNPIKPPKDKHPHKGGRGRGGKGRRR
ncbi:MAG: ribonuclease R [Myxococcaceae bacterium]|nr:ribonuclease R [Myxococcaceae bacterium]